MSDLLSWFQINKSTNPIHLENVQNGLHPLGYALSKNPGASCARCVFRQRDERYQSPIHHCLRYLREHPKVGYGEAQVRIKWGGCEHFRTPE
jgi:hypothetical protein